MRQPALDHARLLMWFPSVSCRHQDSSCAEAGSLLWMMLSIRSKLNLTSRSPGSRDLKLLSSGEYLLGMIIPFKIDLYPCGATADYYAKSVRIQNIFNHNFPLTNRHPLNFLQSICLEHPYPSNILQTIEAFQVRSFS